MNLEKLFLGDQMQTVFPVQRSLYGHEHLHLFTDASLESQAHSLYFIHPTDNQFLKMIDFTFTKFILIQYNLIICHLCY